MGDDELKFLTEMMALCERANQNEDMEPRDFMVEALTAYKELQGEQEDV